VPAAAASARLDLTVADLLAAAAHCGPACSHLILAQEEVVKARALGWIWEERELKTKTNDEDDLRARLSNHPPRHRAAVVQSWSGGMQAEILARALRETTSRAGRNGTAPAGISRPSLRRGSWRASTRTALPPGWRP
jgi:AbiV family abortive infection protein